MGVKRKVIVCDNFANAVAVVMSNDSEKLVFVLWSAKLVDVVVVVGRTDMLASNRLVSCSAGNIFDHDVCVCVCVCVCILYWYKKSIF